MSGGITADLTITVVHSYKLMINDVKVVLSLTHLLTICLELNNIKSNNVEYFFRMQNIYTMLYTNA